MKKLNRKGFTLVELLAVIIILAIVVGITIPAVLTTISNTRVKAGLTAAESVADWVDRQYQTAVTGLSTTSGGQVATLDAYFENQCGSDGSSCEISGGKNINSSDFIAAAGVKTSNVSAINVAINKNTGRSCVTLTLIDGGEYYNANATSTDSYIVSKTTSGDTTTTTITVKGGVCTTSSASSSS